MVNYHCTSHNTELISGPNNGGVVTLISMNSTAGEFDLAWRKVTTLVGPISAVRIAGVLSTSFVIFPEHPKKLKIKIVSI